MNNSTQGDWMSSLNDGPSIGTSCCTGTLIDFSEEVRIPSYSNALMTIAEVDDTFGLFEKKSRSSSAPESVFMSSTVLEESEESGNNNNVRRKINSNSNNDSKETLSGISTISNGHDTSSAGGSISSDRRFNEAFINNSTIADFGTEIANPDNDSSAAGGSISVDRRNNEAFINNSTIADFGNETANPDNYADKSKIINSTPLMSNTQNNNDAVFFSPLQSKIRTFSAAKGSKLLENQIGDSSADSDLLDIDNLSTFSISDSSDTSSTETKKCRFEFLSPRKGKSPGAIKARLKNELKHKTLINSGRGLPLTNQVPKTSETPESTPMVMALRKKMADQKIMNEEEKRNVLKAPVPSRRIFLQSDTSMSDDPSKLSNMSKPTMLSSSFSSPEANQKPFALPTPAKEYAEARKQAITPVRPRTQSIGGGLPTPTKTVTPRTVMALGTPSRSTYMKPSTPTGTARVMVTPSRSQYGSQTLSTGQRTTPVSKRYSFSSSSSSDGVMEGVSYSNVLSMDKVRSTPMTSLTVAFKSKPMAVGAPQVRGGDSRTMPRAKIGPLKATAPIVGHEQYSENKITRSFRSAANTSITSQNELKRSEIRGNVSAPVYRKFAPPIASSSPKPVGGSSANNSFSLGTPTRNRNIRSSGYGQAAMNTSITKAAAVEPSRRIPSASPSLGNTNARNIMQPQAKIQNAATGDKQRSSSQSDANTSKIGRALAAMPQFQFSRSTKENNVRQITKPTSGK